MKLKLTTLLFLVGLILSAQKQLQPYNFSITEDGKTESILIYASAEAVNSITFTLKNTENETLKREKENEEGVEDITFKVFPFTEVIFRKKLIENISKIIEKDTSKPEFSRLKAKIKPLDKKGESENNLKNKEEIKKDSITEGLEKENKKLKEENETFKTRKEAVYIIRNIYQFFNALVITAFQYDNEPVAGVLNYNLDSLIVIKKTIQGLDTDFYFKKQAKFIRNHILNEEKKEKSDELIQQIKEFYKNKDIINQRLNNTNNLKRYVLLEDNYVIEIENYIKKETDGFLKFLRTYDNARVLKELYEFNQNSRKGLWSRAKSEFKKHATHKLKEYYNIYELSRMKDGVISKYYELKKEVKSLKRQDSLNQVNLNANLNLISFKNDSITSLKSLKDTLNYGLEKIKRELINQQIQIDNLHKKEMEYYQNWSSIAEKTTHADSIEKARKQYDSIKELNRQKIFEYNRLFERKTKSRRKELSDVNSAIGRISTDIDDLKNDNNSLLDKTNVHKSQILKKAIEEYNLIIKNQEIIKHFPLWVIKAKEIELDFNDGFLEHMKVVGEILKPHYKETVDKDLKQFFKEGLVKEILNDIFGKQLVFQNDFPFGFSSKSDFADLHNYSLYQSEGQEKIFSLPVTNVISYIQRHQNDRLDFSPKDQVVRLPLDDPNMKGEIELKKETSSKILSVNIFTDFNGFQENTENGLLQMEVDKKIPIWTKRMNLRLGRSSNFGFVNYANFNLSWQKIGEEDKELVLAKSNRFENNQQVTDFYTTYLDLVKHENISVGVDLNIASFDFPLAKTRLELNTGAHYGRIKVVDKKIEPLPDGATSTTRDFEETINMIRLYPDIMLWIRPEERFGGYLRYRPFRTIVPNNEKFFSVSSGKDFEENQILSKNWLNRFELSAFFTPSSDSDNKFFFRYRYTNNSTWETNGYSEVQVGYLAYLKF
ncbi:hypothetical protein [Hwangdonia lutea]|uniref:Uncharacterized protein n=1 Tax=Hwangdonia lutea TaxID=3075823 RepID=A0AA97EPV2_9FLAO|nr:hypothetical protein [Hwangdonia sp. SCSIO 19198]WOD44886.1 hypothetical protein RNZ46_06360 [Hwangdonia sp. SCSIO 19198]